MSGASQNVLKQALQLGGAIALPLVLLLAIGRFLDVKFGTSPSYLLTGLGLSLISTTFVLMRVARAAREAQKSDEQGGRRG